MVRRPTLISQLRNHFREALYDSRHSVIIHYVSLRDFSGEGAVRISGLISALFFATCLSLAVQSIEIPPMLHLNDSETFRKANLSPGEMKEIFEQVERTSFDSPDSWESELRIRRQQVGGSEGLIVQATKGLCGATGNCEIWVFRRGDGKWLSMFEEHAPMIAGFAFTKEQSHGVENFIGVGHMSPESTTYVVFRFDGRFYRLTDCYERYGDHSAKKVACE